MGNTVRYDVSADYYCLTGLMRLLEQLVLVLPLLRGKTLYPHSVSLVGSCCLLENSLLICCTIMPYLSSQVLHVVNHYNFNEITEQKRGVPRGGNTGQSQW
jgi:hypothetical protein